MIKHITLARPMTVYTSNRQGVVAIDTTNSNRNFWKSCLVA